MNLQLLQKNWHLLFCIIFYTGCNLSNYHETVEGNVEALTTAVTSEGCEPVFHLLINLPLTLLEFALCKAQATSAMEGFTCFCTTQSTLCLIQLVLGGNMLKLPQEISDIHG